MDSANFPKTIKFQKSFEIDNETITLYLFIVEFANAVQVSIYEDIPKIGSYSLGYYIDGRSENFSIFSGNNEELSKPISLLLAQKMKKIVYTSVHIEKVKIFTLSHIKELLNEYLN